MHRNRAGSFLRCIFLPTVCAWGLMFGLYQAGVSCSTPGPVTTTVVQSYSVNREVFMGLWQPVVSRTTELAGSDDALFNQVVEAEMAVAVHKGDIPWTAGHQVGVVCDIHDLLIRTSPDPQPYLEHYLRSTEILRQLFAAAGEPVFTE